MRYVLDENTAVLRICSTFLLLPAGGPEGLCPPIYTLNETAYMLLEKMEEPCNLEDLAGAVSEICDGDMEQILNDTKKILDVLLQKEFIRKVS